MLQTTVLKQLLIYNGEKYGSLIYYGENYGSLIRREYWEKNYGITCVQKTMKFDLLW